MRYASYLEAAYPRVRSVLFGGHRRGVFLDGRVIGVVVFGGRGCGVVSAVVKKSVSPLLRSTTFVVWWKIVLLALST